MSSGGTEIIVYSPARLTAVVIRGGDNMTLSVNRSVLVREADALYAPVGEVLESSCTKEISSEAVSDRGMMFGQAVRTKWTVWAECPDEPHDCVALPIPVARKCEEGCGIGEIPIC